jgi:predicted GTPase
LTLKNKKERNSKKEEIKMRASAIRSAAALSEYAVPTIILGAAGRDFHNFNTLYRNNRRVNVVAFTAAQIPDIAGRIYPAVLAGKLYPNGIPIVPQDNLENMIHRYGVERAIFSYSDVPYIHIGNIAAKVNAAGAEFVLPNLFKTMLPSNKPVISIGAVRTGCGKSQTTRKVVEILKNMDFKPVVIRHPMPYGDLAEQAVQRFATLADLTTHKCTIEEIEEYEPHIVNGTVVYAGVDYGAILKQAEKEANVIIWDGGNNDTSFYDPDLQIAVVDPLRPGHEISYYPGEVNFRWADVLVMNKMDCAKCEDIRIVEENIKQINPDATVIKANSPVTVDNPEVIRGTIMGKRVLVIEDGPTVTHGDMPFGAGSVASSIYAAIAVDPYPYAVGSIKETFNKYRHLIGANILPAMGYGTQQLSELEQTINALWNGGKIDAVVIGTPIDLGRLLTIQAPSTRVRYNLEEIGTPTIETVLNRFVEEQGLG